MPAETIRQLAAIMFSDIVGYTAMMQKDENKALLARQIYKEVIESHIKNHSGQIIQNYGDGTLSIFSSAVNAVNCAIAIQKKLKDNPEVPLKIGLHTGDIIFDNDGAYGDGVNIASRIESISVAGGILLSEKLFDEIKNQPSFHTISLGEFEFKNVDKPIEVFAIANEGINTPSINKKNKLFKSIAVLPFTNMSADPENEYFSDGISEEVINALTRIKGLAVTSRTSSFAFKGLNQDVREIAVKLNVDTVLEGSVRKSGNKIRVTAQLINAADGYHIFSEVYDRDLTDIFAIQDEIALNIVDKLQAKINGNNGSGIQQEPEKHVLVKNYTQNMDAYQLFLKGRHYWNKWSVNGTQQAIKYFNEAIDLEPNFALPYSGLAVCYSFLGAIWKQINPRESYQKAKSAAYKAIELDNAQGESHMALGILRLFYDYDFDGAYISLKKAIDLNPGKAEVHHAFYMYLNAVEQYEQSLEEIRIAKKLDPFSIPINCSLGHVLMLSGRTDEAIHQYENALELDPNSNIARKGLGWAYIKKGNLEEAIEILKKVAEARNNDRRNSALGYAYAKAGLVDKALDHILKIKTMEATSPTMTYFIDYAIIYSGLGDKDKAFNFLKKAYYEREGGMVFIKSNPAFMELKSDDRFAELEKMIGFNTSSFIVRS